MELISNISLVRLLPTAKLDDFVILMQIMGYVKCVVKFLKDKLLLQPPIIASVCIAAVVFY